MAALAALPGGTPQRGPEGGTRRLLRRARERELNAMPKASQRPLKTTKKKPTVTDGLFLCVTPHP